MIYNKLLLLLLFLTIAIIFKFYYKIENFSNKCKNKISIVIPCIPRDIKYLDRLLISIKNQTFQPYEIIIAISEYSFNKSKLLEKKLINKYNLPIKIINSNNKHLPSGNRNRGSLKATGDIITFMDADDIMYPYKLEYINIYFNKYNPKVFIHSYSKGYNNFEKTNKNPEIYFGDQIYDMAIKSDGTILNNILNWRNTNDKIYINNKMHHGHVTIPRYIIKKIKFREGYEYKRGEDCVFIREILDTYGRHKNTALFVNIPLSQYIPSAKQN
tara:strand:- start:154 stop:966 length:813 start_codon:yes stop_codon:yes gene_type:complete